MSEAVNILMRRCAVMGFRAAMIVTACYQQVKAKQLETIRNVFKCVADYSLFELVTRFEIVIKAKENREQFTQKSVLILCPMSSTVLLLYRPAQRPATKLHRELLFAVYSRQGLPSKLVRTATKKLPVSVTNVTNVTPISMYT